MKKHIIHMYKSFGYSLLGMKKACAEMSVRQEIVIGGIASFVLFWVQAPLLNQIVFWMLLLMVLGIEILNTCIENIADKIDPTHNPFTGDVKDMASFAVLCFICAIAIWWGYSLYISIV